MLLAVYSDVNDLPGQRLAVTEETQIHFLKGWQTVKLTTAVDVNEGDTIWLAWVFENNPGIRCESGTPGRANSGQTWAGGMPSEFGSSTTAGYIYSVYANYTPDEQDQDIELIGNPYMFTGRRFDLETGLYYYRARYYNPCIGRFLQTDPAKEGINWYSYCSNNPLSCRDPNGLYAVAFYEGTTEKDVATLGEAADDFFYNFNLEERHVMGMNVAEYILFILESLNMLVWYPITEVYFYTHASGPDGLEISGYTVSPGTQPFISFCEGLKKYTHKNAIIHLRGCYQGAKDENGRRVLIEEMAKATNRNVTGCESTITYWIWGRSGGRDYDFQGWVYMSDPEGNISIYWKPEIIYMSPSIPTYRPPIRFIVRDYHYEIY